MSQMSYTVFRTLAIVLLLPLASFVAAQQPVTTRYVYDQNGRLRAVITPEGAAIYDYDPAGNFTAIRRLGANACEALEFTPRQGPPSTLVTIYGVGFNGEVRGVMFNGAPAMISGQTATAVTVRVPDSATSGPLTINLRCGERTFTTPFTVSGVMVLPEFITVAPGRTAQFTAKVAGVVDPRVKWSVSEIEGGNETVGRINENGLYTAPSVAANAALTFMVRATLVTETNIFGEGQAKVTASGYEILASGVAVRYGTPANNTIAFVAGTVAARYGDPPKNGSVYVAGATSVRYGEPPKNGLVYVASPVAVTYGEPPGNGLIYLSNSLAARFEPPPARGLAPLINSVSVTRSATVSAIVVNAVARGETVTLAVKGANLSAITAIQFIKDDGTEEAHMVASNLKFQADGTLLKAKVSVSRQAQPGRRSVRLLTATERLPLSAVGIIEVIP